MSNPVIERLIQQRSEQEQFIAGMLARVAEEERDLVDAERANLTAAQERITAIDAQLQPLEAFEETLAQHRAANPTARPAAPAGGGSQRLVVTPRAHKYATVGDFLVDHMRAVGDPFQRIAPDADAAQRVASSLTRAEGDVAPGTHVTTADTPGLLPTPIVGEILTELDGSRPFVTSVGVKSLSSIPGKTFERPYVTKSSSVAEQAEEKAELVMGEFKVDGIPFDKRTFGGFLNVSRQDIDWTSPSAWNALVSDLQFEYAEETEDVVASSFAAAITQEVTLEGDDLDAWIAALYEAAVVAATANGTKRARARRLPDTIWTSIDQWAALGSVIDAVRARNNSQISSGQSSVGAFAGSLLDVPRVMVPGFPTGTVVVGRSTGFEFYEERIGLLQAIEPKVFGVEVAYGGYAAWGHLDKTQYAKVVPAPVIP